MAHVFLSYSRIDTSIMQQVRNDMETALITVWTDAGIQPGTPSWKLVIEEEIKKAVCLVCILSPDALQSRWVREEQDFAELHGKKIFLLLARGEKTQSIPFGFSSNQWVDIRTDYSLVKTLFPVIKELVGASKILEPSNPNTVEQNKENLEKKSKITAQKHVSAVIQRTLDQNVHLINPRFFRRFRGG